jgi:hypothetical protein
MKPRACLGVRMIHGGIHGQASLPQPRLTSSASHKCRAGQTFRGLSPSIFEPMSVVQPKVIARGQH